MFKIDFMAQNADDARAILADEEVPSESIRAALLAAIDEATATFDGPVYVHAIGTFFERASATYWTDYHIAVRPIVFSRPIGAHQP